MVCEVRGRRHEKWEIERQLHNAGKKNLPPLSVDLFNTDSFLFVWTIPIYFCSCSCNLSFSLEAHTHTHTTFTLSSSPQTADWLSYLSSDCMDVCDICCCALSASSSAESCSLLATSADSFLSSCLQGKGRRILYPNGPLPLPAYQHKYTHTAYIYKYTYKYIDTHNTHNTPVGLSHFVPTLHHH